MTDDNKDKTAGVVAGGLAPRGGVHSLPRRGLLKIFHGNTLKQMETKKQRQDVRTIVHLFSELRDCKLTEGQQILVKGMQKYFRQTGTLSERQLNTLLEIRQYCDGKL